VRISHHAGRAVNRVRTDRVGRAGSVTLRANGRLHHIGVGRVHHRTRVLILDPSKESPHHRGQTSFSGVVRDLICGSEGDSTAALAGTMRTVIAAVVRTAEVPPRLTGGLVSVGGGGRRAQWSDRRVRER
jgi:hypothetical protein